ncbi:MAG: RT0821/Lpp0805 family surface protein [Gammaproteobacteria bacterium]
MDTIDEITLIAYVDGEIDPATAAEIEERLARDPALRAKVRELRESTALVRAAFNHVLYEQPPVLDFGAAETAKVVSLKPRARKSPWPARSGLALAASLAALVVGGASGYWWHGDGASTSLFSSADEAHRTRAFLQGMDKELSGTPVNWRNPNSGNEGTLIPVRTFQARDGQYCREFEENRVINGVSRSEGGIACRGANGEWQVRMRFYPE